MRWASCFLGPHAMWTQSRARPWTSVVNEPYHVPFEFCLVVDTACTQYNHLYAVPYKIDALHRTVPTHSDYFFFLRFLPRPPLDAPRRPLPPNPLAPLDGELEGAERASEGSEGFAAEPAGASPRKA